MAGIEEQLKIIPECLVDCVEESRLRNEPEYTISSTNAVVNDTDNPDEVQVIVGCTVEGCTAEIETFGDPELDTFSVATSATLQGAYLVCKNRRTDYGKRS